MWILDQEVNFLTLIIIMMMIRMMMMMMGMTLLNCMVMSISFSQTDLMMLKRMEAMMGMMTLLSCLMISSSKLAESNSFASAIASALYCDS